MSEVTTIPTTVTMAEAAKLLQVSERTLFNLRKRGQLAASKLGRCVRFNLADVMRLLECTKEADDGKR